MLQKNNFKGKKHKHYHGYLQWYQNKSRQEYKIRTEYYLRNFQISKRDLEPLKHDSKQELED